MYKVISFPRLTWLFIIIAFVGAFVMTRGLVVSPTYTDAYYHLNGALRLAEGDGFTEEYLWVYVGDPESLPAPSHQYWMPFTSIIASVSMTLFNSTDYAIAQFPFMLLFAGVVLIGYWLGGRIGGTQRHRWLAGLLTLFSGFFVRWWGAIDTFAPYAFVGALCLIFIGLAVHPDTKSPYRIRYWLLAGLCAGFGHLTRADGLLLLLAGWMVLFLPWGIAGIKLVSLPNFSKRVGQAVIFTAGYLVIMMPWFVHNLDTIGTPLSIGGTDSVWFTEYNDLFNYPAGATPEALFEDGIDTFAKSRLTAFLNNLGTFVAVEGLIAMSPLMLIGLWNRRRHPFFLGFWLYAIGLHLAMTFVFPFAGYRGGLFHSAAALVPWWAILGILGLDDLIDWIAKRRHTWNPRTAKPVFSGALLVLALILSFQFGLNQINFSRTESTPRLYRELREVLPSDARIMINDPSALYYFTGLGGVVTPNADPSIILEIAERYNITHFLIEIIEHDGETHLAIPEQLGFDLDTPPSFLSEVDIDVSSARLYAITSE